MSKFKFVLDVQEDSEEFVEDMVEQVLAMDVDHNLITQATHLLEEPDITNVLNTIQADEFSDFFTGKIFVEVTLNLVNLLIILF